MSWWPALLLGAEAHLLPLGKGKEGEESPSTGWAVGQSRAGMGGDIGAACVGLHPTDPCAARCGQGFVLCCGARASCCILEIQHLWQPVYSRSCFT